MEMLSGVSVDTFKNLVWLAAFIVGALFVIGSPVSSPLKIAARTVSALLAATVSFAAANLAVVFYILAHLTDPRWSVGKDPTLDSPQLSAGPFFQPITDTLNDILGSLTGSLNNAIALKNAFLTMPDFIIAAGWAFLLLLPLVIAVRITAWFIEKEQVRQIDRNTRDLADIRAQFGLAAFKDTAKWRS
ncbi:hypothetical protein [Pseudarthrobacter sp. C1]|uniref:hypothetical protein n=1 Tax=Pseudarthrobacter sp. C1 TaxID=3108940 RepID=UPI002B0608C6|nr:hypothetical protein [Pseudarthrobacter sp. C1]MEA3549251.1 hypothetical protein [Pseudarthrobacter sp. C1]